MTIDPVVLGLGARPVYESGAILMATVAYPSVAEEDKRANYYCSLCREAILSIAAGNPGWANHHQAIKPAYFLVSDGQAEREIRAGAKVMRERLSAGHKVLAMLLQAQIPDRFKGKNLSLNALSELMAEDLSLDDSTHIKNRVWKPARPVMHAAAALQWMIGECTETIVPGAESLPMSLFLEEARLLKSVLERAQAIAELLPALKGQHFTDGELVRFVAE